MAIRPVDLQQTIIKTQDVTRDVSSQQQAGVAQQAHTAAASKRQAEKAETVQHLEDEASAALVRERQARGGQQHDEQDGQPPREGETEEDEALTKAAAAQARLGRHIDLHA